MRIHSKATSVLSTQSFANAITMFGIFPFSFFLIVWHIKMLGFLPIPQDKTIPAASSWMTSTDLQRSYQRKSYRRFLVRFSWTIQTHLNVSHQHDAATAELLCGYVLGIMRGTGLDHAVFSFVAKNFSLHHMTNFIPHIYWLITKVFVLFYSLSKLLWSLT